MQPPTAGLAFGGTRESQSDWSDARVLLSIIYGKLE